MKPDPKIIKVDRRAAPLTYTDYDEALKTFYADWPVWEGDQWLDKLWRERGERPYYVWQMPEHQRLLAAAVESFPGSDYELHLVPAGEGLPRPQEDHWVIYAPGRASESLAYLGEQQARRALYAMVAHEVLAAMPFDGRTFRGGYFDPEDAGISALTHVEVDGQVIGFGGITSYLDGNQVVFGLMHAEPFAVNLTGQDDDTNARRILAERLGGVMPLDLEARRARIEGRREQNR